MPRNLDTEPTVAPTKVALSSCTVGPVALAVETAVVSPTPKAKVATTAYDRRDIRLEDAAE